MTYPLKYAQHKNSNRIYLTIGFVWIVSVAIALPMLAGLNDTPNRQPDDCSFNNETFLIYSSMFSFYIPTIIMIFLYYKIFRNIRTRAQNTQVAKTSNSKGAAALKTPNKNTPAQENFKLESNDTKLLTQLVPDPHLITQQETEKRLLDKSAKANSKMVVLKQRLSQHVNNRKPTNSIASSASKKERKITKTLAIVLIVYLVCW